MIFLLTISFTDKSVSRHYIECRILYCFDIENFLLFIFEKTMLFFSKAKSMHLMRCTSFIVRMMSKWNIKICLFRRLIWGNILKAMSGMPLFSLDGWYVRNLGSWVHNSVRRHLNKCPAFFENSRKYYTIRRFWSYKHVTRSKQFISSMAGNKLIFSFNKYFKQSR
jgi:hypothetical protein